MTTMTTTTTDIATQLVRDASELLPLVEMLSGSVARVEAAPDDVEAVHDLLRRVTMVEEILARMTSSAGTIARSVRLPS